MQGRRQRKTNMEALMETLQQPIAALPNTAEADTIPDCQACGACCEFFFDEDMQPLGRRGAGLWVSNDDLSALPKKLYHTERLDVTAWVGTVKTLQDGWLLGRRAHGKDRCKSLFGRVGVKAVCAVYERRPVTCQQFKPGSEPCLAVRKQYGL